MRSRFDNQLAELNRELIEMGAMCEESIGMALKALMEGDKALAKKVAGLDVAIDQKERSIESMCLKLLLQQQPVARDLRQISAALKMITDMERIGDQAEDIAEIITYLSDRSAANEQLMREMANAAIKMVTDSVDAYVKHDTIMAEKVIAADDVVDAYFDRVKHQLIERIAADPTAGEYALDSPMKDDASIRDIEVYALSSAGFAARGFEDGSSFYAAITGEKEKPQLIVLDVMLPGIDGIELLRRIRANAALKQIPIVMATAKGSEYDRIQGLDLGADYYLTKPFGVMELISCVKAVLRRCSAAKEADTLNACGISMNTLEHTVSADGERITLTYKEYELLKLFLSHMGTAFTREQLMERVWGTDYMGETRTIDMHIRTLRQKLGKCGESIKTVRNVGYRMEEGQ